MAIKEIRPMTRECLLIREIGQILRIRDRYCGDGTVIAEMGQILKRFSQFKLVINDRGKNDNSKFTVVSYISTKSKYHLVIGL